MHDWAFHIVSIWLLLAIVALAVRAALVTEIVARTLAVSLLSVFALAALVLVGVQRNEPGFLDGALVLALLGFGQTAAVARFVAAKRETP